MKKVLVALLSAVIVVSMGACGGGGETSTARIDGLKTQMMETVEAQFSQVSEVSGNAQEDLSSLLKHQSSAYGGLSIENFMAEYNAQLALDGVKPMGAATLSEVDDSEGVALVMNMYLSADNTALILLSYDNIVVAAAVSDQWVMDVDSSLYPYIKAMSVLDADCLPLYRQILMSVDSSDAESMDAYMVREVADNGDQAVMLISYDLALNVAELDLI